MGIARFLFCTHVDSTFKFGDSVDHQFMGCYATGAHMVAVALSGDLFYLNPDQPSTPLRIVRVMRFLLLQGSLAIHSLGTSQDNHGLVCAECIDLCHGEL